MRGKALVILWKDILSELRTKDIVISVLVFALLVIVIFNFALEPSPNTALLAAGVLWVAFTFAGVLNLSRSFVLEKDKGCLEGLMLCPLGRGTIYLGKMLGSLAFMFAVEAVVLPIFSVLFNQPIFLPRLILITALATVGFVSVGTLFSAIAVNTKTREIILPILFLPAVIPVVIAAVSASGMVLTGEPWGAIARWLWVIIAFDGVFLAVSPLSFEFVLEE